MVQNGANLLKVLQYFAIILCNTWYNGAQYCKFAQSIARICHEWQHCCNENESYNNCTFSNTYNNITHCNNWNYCKLNPQFAIFFNNIMPLLYYFMHKCNVLQEVMQTRERIANLPKVCNTVQLYYALKK